MIADTEHISYQSARYDLSYIYLQRPKVPFISLYPLRVLPLDALLIPHLISTPLCPESSGCSFP
jgi:hypothetical protein